MAATTDQKARLLDLTTTVLELVRDDKRSIMGVSAVLQAIKDDLNFVQRLLGNGDVAAMPMRLIWRMLTIGGKTQKQLREELAKGNFYVSGQAADIMQKSAFLPLAETTEVQLVRIKVGDLGFTHQPTSTELFARAKERGLDLCPAEVGPHLCLADKDQPRGTWYWVAMEPISDSGGYPRVFHVERSDGGGRWLLAYYASPGHRWSLGSPVVFVLRK